MRRKQNGSTITTGDITFAAGYITRYLEDYAGSRAVPAQPFALGVAELVRATALGQVLGTENPLSSLRPGSTQRGETMEPVAVARRPYRRKTQLKRRKNKGVKNYWASMTPEERSREMKRRMNLNRQAA